MIADALNTLFSKSLVSPYREMVSFEVLYSKRGSSLKKMADLTVSSGRLPSQALGMLRSDDEKRAEEAVADYLDRFRGEFNIAVNQTPTWPKKLNDSERPTPILYYRGDIGLIESKSVSVVGSRKASRDGLSRAFKIARELIQHNVTIVTGLAKGIDTAATEAAIEFHGRTIGVIGTPITEYYPKENRDIQDYVAREHLLISQVPFYKHSIQPFRTKRYYFPERNELMAAVSDATIIVEASDTSGTLTQARACIHQKRPLFIMRSCLENKSITWPKKYIDKEGVFILDSVEQVLEQISRR